MDFIITKTQIFIILFAIAILILSYVIFKKTKIGLALRAITNNKELAEIYGINSNKVILWSFIIAGILGSFAGIIIALEYVLTPTIGTTYILKGFIGAVTGGLNSLYGSIFGSYVLSLFENYGSWYFSSSYKDAIAFALLFIVLLFKPTGLFGIKKGVRK